jgi:tetratricopeptide (TPR) repeat protein
LERALANAQRGQLKEVEGSLWAAVRNDPADAPLVLEALAQGYMETFRWSEALGCLGQLLESHPDDTEVLTWRGWVLENLHRTAEARADYQKAVELAPEHVEARLRLGEALLQTNLPGEALMHFEHVRERQPDNPTMLLGLVRCLQLLNRLEEARRVLDRLLLQKPVPAPVLTEKGKLALSLGETAEAEKWLRQSFALAPHDRDTNFQLYRCLEQSGKEEEAKAFFATFQRIERDQDRLQDLFREMQKKPRDLSLRAEAGLILLRNGQTPEGIRLLEGVLQEDPRHKSAHQALADYYQSQGYNDRAMQHRRAAEESR